VQLQIHPPLDLLAAEDGRSLLNEPLIKRRILLEKFATAHFDRGRIRLSPATLKLAQAKKWLAKTGTMLDGIVAKRRHVAYRSGERDGMQKIKNFRTADCVVGGFRYAGGGKVVGSLLPGLYDSQGLLHHVGFTSSLGRRRSTWTDQSTLPKAVGSVTTAAMRSADPDWAGAALKSVRERRDRPVSPRA